MFTAFSSLPGKENKYDLEISSQVRTVPRNAVHIFYRCYSSSDSTSTTSSCSDDLEATDSIPKERAGPWGGRTYICSKLLPLSHFSGWLFFAHFRNGSTSHASTSTAKPTRRRRVASLFQSVNFRMARILICLMVQKSV